MAGGQLWYLAFAAALLTATGLLLAMHPARGEILRAAPPRNLCSWGSAWSPRSPASYTPPA